MASSRYIVFLDLDGTLTGINSGYALVRTALSTKLIGMRVIVRSIWLSAIYKLGVAPADRIIESMGLWLNGMEEKILKDTAALAADKYLKSSVFAGAVKEIEYHKTRGAALALLSSAVEEICKPVAEYLGIDYILCTEMGRKGTKLTGLPSGKYCFGEEKRIRMERFCRENMFDISSSWYFADSYSDFPALEITGNPVCINPDRRLKKAASARGWKILTWSGKDQK